MLDSLVKAVEDLAKRIAAGRFRSEAEISQGVVKRVFHELGWPVFDTQVVAPEFKIGPRKADYALCQPPGKPAVLVEVKDIGKADGKGEKQLFEYCFHQGVPIAVLTDGRQWSFFFPAGLGSYEERRFAKLDLVKDDPGAVARVLTRYLNMADVGSDAARQRAERDYAWGREQRKAVAKFPAVWQELLREPDPALLDLFSLGVEKAAGVRPGRELAVGFIRGQAEVAGSVPPQPVRPAVSDPPSVPPKPKPSPEPVQSTLPSKPTPDAPPTKDRPTFTFRGQTRSFKTGKELLGALFREFASQHPEFCQRYSERFSGRTLQYVATSRDLLYPGQPKLQHSAVISLPGGWWLGTNFNNHAKLKRIKEACEVAGLVFGEDIVVNIP